MRLIFAFDCQKCLLKMPCHNNVFAKLLKRLLRFCLQRKLFRLPCCNECAAFHFILSRKAHNVNVLQTITQKNGCKTKSVAPFWEQRRCFLNFEKSFARTFAQQIEVLSNVLCNEFRQVFLGATCSDYKVYVVFVAYFFQTVVQNAQLCHVAVQQAG